MQVPREQVTSPVAAQQRPEGAPPPACIKPGTVGQPQLAGPLEHQHLHWHWHWHTLWQMKCKSCPPRWKGGIRPQVGCPLPSVQQVARASVLLPCHLCLPQRARQRRGSQPAIVALTSCSWLPPEPLIFLRLCVNHLGICQAPDQLKPDYIWGDKGLGAGGKR